MKDVGCCVDGLMQKKIHKKNKNVNVQAVGFALVSAAICDPFCQWKTSVDENRTMYLFLRDDIHVHVLENNQLPYVMIA